MNAPTPEDVFRGVRDRLRIEPGWDAAVPGDVWYAKRPGGKVFPYAVGMVEADEPLLVQSDGSYLQAFTVEVSVWVESADAEAADTATPANLLERALGWKEADPAGGVSVPGAAKVVHVHPTGGTLRLTESLRKGQDVFAAGKRVQVMIQGKRT